MAKTLGDIQLLILKHPAGAGLDAALLRGYINARYKEIVERYDWNRLIKSATLQTVAIYETGTVALTEGVNTVTGTGTTFTTAMTGRRFRVTGRNETYVFTYVSATAGTLDRVYEGESETEATYKIFKSIYALASSAYRIESIKVPAANRDLDQVGREYLDNHAPNRDEYGDPRMYALYDDSTDADPLIQIELYPIPENAQGYPVRFRDGLTELSATSDKVLPWVNHYAIVTGVEADLCALQKDYAGMQIKEAKFQTLIQDMIRQDILQTEVEALEMLPHYTNHRAQRAYGDDYDPEMIAFIRQS